MSSTWFDTISASYTSLDVTKGVDTQEFLAATESLVTLFDLIHATAFAQVKADMLGNVKKLRAQYVACPDQSKTIEDLVKYEATKKKRTATEGLVWLLRGLDFTAQAIRYGVTHPEKELTECFTIAYSNTLKQYHNFLIRGVFSLAMKACPYRKDFYQKLGSDQAKVQEQLEAWLSALEALVAHLQTFLKSNGYDQGF
ncbi:MAG: putative glycolipid transfer protein [Piptocephalis tieghemiana]|nr:MAG: putative glycolipid transfer protein [Piptocephalis tieghemiana]